ncbi:peptidylprolyl isomerase [Rhodothermus profundi]|uniref:Peptidyl-prolyl cis-trans isomerase C n=1 Tax=Rhodothermus profundi TaxID=633813 RepID=A0A1M6QME5_9BACT|nr:peptidylprolyl isomerase [Rhodothermus profundi]SHK21207.1 peptidyl-prolyl cis-trans isomerase C [Rhodothermus profundi]
MFSRRLLQVGRLLQLPALLSLTLLLSLGCRAQDTEANATSNNDRSYQVGAPLSDSTVAAIVTSEYGVDTLTAEAFRQQLGFLLQRYPQLQMNPALLPEVHKSIIEDFIVRHVVDGEIVRQGIQADPAAVEQELEQIRSRFPSPEAFQEALAQDGLTEDSLRSMIAQMVRQRTFREQIEARATPPTDAEIEQFRQQQAEEVRVQHILFRLAPDAPEAEVAAVKARAQAVLDSIRAGADFAEMARRHSEDGSAQEGGDLGFIRRGETLEAFEQAAFALTEAGDVTPEPVRTRFGYHLIRLLERRQGTLMDVAEAREKLLQERKQEAVQNLLKELLAKATVRINPALVQAQL